ncbi:MAG: acyl carrier protein phosphodiesterase [Halioglobus sp.]|jgi:acyl carrier protein phosphodiesterase
MNFLAHFHLAWPDEGMIAGGLEGDFYKGLLPGDLPEHILRGVKLHRAIDAFTDNHALIVELRTHFPTPLRRYAGILIDLSFDHYLTQHWSKYSRLKLTDFNSRVCRILNTHEAHLSEGSRTMLGRIQEYDILNLYHDWDTVTATATRIGERFQRGNPLLDVDTQLPPIKHELERTFLEFYPKLLTFSETQQAHLN